MDIERLVALIVKTVVEELTRQGIISSDHSSQQASPDRTVTSGKTNTAQAYVADRRVISEQVVLEASRAGYSVVEIASDALVTALAEDTAKEKGLRIRRG